MIDPKILHIREANRLHALRASGGRIIDSIGPNDRENLVIRGMRGLGDNINQRAFIKELGFHVWLDTPWPELYSDMEDQITFVECSTSLRTQIKNISRQPKEKFKELPAKNRLEIVVQYGSRDLAKMSILKKLSLIFGGIKPKVFDLPKFPWPSKVEQHSKIAVVRPATVRREWAAISRNPDPEYLRKASLMLMEKGYYVVSVADLEDGHEYLVEPAPFAHLKLHQGELCVEDLIGLCQGATVLCGGHGWLTHVALSEKKPMLVVAGGFGGDNNFKNVADPEFVDNSCLTWIQPDRFCMCQDMTHKCDKKISDFEGKARKWIQNIP